MNDANKKAIIRYKHISRDGRVYRCKPEKNAVPGSALCTYGTLDYLRYLDCIICTRPDTLCERQSIVGRNRVELQIR